MNIPSDPSVFSHHHIELLLDDLHHKEWVFIFTQKTTEEVKTLDARVHHLAENRFTIDVVDYLGGLAFELELEEDGRLQGRYVFRFTAPDWPEEVGDITFIPEAERQFIGFPSSFAASVAWTLSLKGERACDH